MKRLATAYWATHAPDGLTSTVQPGRAPRFTKPNQAERAGKSATTWLILGLGRSTAEAVMCDGHPSASIPRPLDQVGGAAGPRRDLPAPQPQARGLQPQRGPGWTGQGGGTSR